MQVRVPLVAFVVLLGAAPVFAAEPLVDYSRDIRPILSRNCFACHGPDEGSREAGLRLDLRETAIAELRSGATAIVVGKPDESELIKRVTETDEYAVMPPKESGKTLTAEQIELLRRWVAQGAPYADHWSFSPIADPELPPVDPALKPRNGVDHFVFARLAEENLKPSPEADRLTLVRRLSLDLTGLPPTEEEIEAFLSDTDPKAYERLVDRLLNSPHFGERWGRHWLDLARYADSNGYLGDELRATAFRYRDWVIEAINSDLPYDQFTIQQIAGDLLENGTLEQRVATGLHRNSMKNTEAGADRELDRVIQTVDRLATVGTAWLGLTVACAECHSHKFDPISHREFYQLYAFFNNLQEHELKIGETPPKPETPEQRLERENKLKAIQEQLEQNASAVAVGGEEGLLRSLQTLAVPKAERSETDRESLETWLADLDEKGKKLAGEYEKIAQTVPRSTPVTAPTVREATKNRRPTHIHHRGDFRQPGEEVQPNTPAFLPPLRPRGEVADRLDLARWLVRDDHPLTARTAVNHVWKHLFGRGLVDPADNFGMAGGEPSHPELLDWLSRRFMESGWSRKELIRLIVTSATYRQSSAQTDELRKRDPQNVLLARQGRFRLEGEIVRDVALSAAGLLNRKVGGASIRPPMNSRITAVSRNQDWTVSPGTQKYRRGMYILFRRATPFPMLTVFDVPDSSVSCADRERSNSPLQALTLLNDPVFFECAQELGHHLARLGDIPAEEWTAVAFRRVLCRPPTSEELQRLVELSQEQRRLLEEVPLEDIALLIGKPVAEMPPREQATRLLVARSLMNLDEFMTRE